MISQALSWACPTCSVQPMKPCEENGVPVYTYVHASRVQLAIEAAAEGSGESVPVTEQTIENTGLF